MNPYDAAHHLVKAIRESGEFKEFKKARDDLKSDPSAKKMFIDLRSKQIELQKQSLSGIEVSQEQKEKVNKLLEVVSMNMVAKLFLETEYKMARLMQDVQNIIGEAVEEIHDEDLMTISEDDSNGKE